MLGELPSDWPVVTIGSLTRVKRGASPRPIQDPKWFSDEGHGWVRISDVTASDRVLRQTTQYLSDAGRAASVEIVPGDLIMSICGTIGRPLFSGIHACIHDGFVAFREIDKARLDPDYLYFFLQAQTRHFEAQSQPGTQRNLNSSLVGTTEIPLPPLDEQRRIAEVLRSVDEAIASNQKCLTQAGSVRAALLQRHFHMAEWADGQPLPDGWEMPLLDAVATRGSGHTPNKKIDSYWNGGIKWVSLQDTKKLDQVYISTTAQQISDDGIRNSSAVLHPDGVVIISRDATVGRSAITVGPMAVSQHFIAYRCGKMLNNHYLYYWLQRMKPVFERIGAGSTIKTIGLPFFKSLRIALPPLQQQSQIADVMLDADKAMMSAAAAIHSLHKVKAVVMSDLLSGHVRVPA